MAARLRSAALVLVGALVIFCGRPAGAQRYFDAHNHITGVLPYYAYANLPAFIASLSHPQQTVSLVDRLALYRYLAEVWGPAERGSLGNRLFSPPDGQRFALGARAALVLYHDQIGASATALNGVLERVLTATPWSEFDSAYAFRGGPAGAYLRARFYGGNDEQLGADLCKGTVLDLAATNIDQSEQSLPFIGGWKFVDGRSGALDTIECTMNALYDPAIHAALRAMNRPMPTIKIVLMTHTAQLATAPGATGYSEWSKTGACAWVALPRALTTAPKAVYNALMGWSQGRLVVPSVRAVQYYDTVVGIDTAGPETTCFSPDGMRYYEQLAGAVYAAAKSRRMAGWHGKLLVHTHVGEGAVIQYAPAAPALPWTFQSLFAALPPTRTNVQQAQANISTLLAAIARFEADHPDAHDYVVFRLAHDTWASAAQAQAMHDEGVEADVNLESNVATGAYPVSRMPISQAGVLTNAIGPIAANPATNFELNDLLGTLVKDPANVSQVGGILGNASLKYLLEARVRCLLGTDADGVEHSDIVKEYEYASSLIAYWNQTDQNFRALSGDAGRQTLFDNVRWHLSNMSSNVAAPY
jgi:hypothetical protein